jgi:hypothetical protein
MPQAGPERPIWARSRAFQEEMGSYWAAGRVHEETPQALDGLDLGDPIFHSEPTASEQLAITVVNSRHATAIDPEGSQLPLGPCLQAPKAGTISHGELLGGILIADLAPAEVSHNGVEESETA